jgi:hypothetical protein
MSTLNINPLKDLIERFSSAARLRLQSFELLRTLGIRAARRFLAAHYENVGVRSSIDLRAELAAVYAPAQDTFGRTVVFTPLKSQPGRDPYTASGNG